MPKRRTTLERQEEFILRLKQCIWQGGYGSDPSNGFDDDAKKVAAEPGWFRLRSLTYEIRNKNIIIGYPGVRKAVFAIGEYELRGGRSETLEFRGWDDVRSVCLVARRIHSHMGEVFYDPQFEGVGRD